MNNEMNASEALYGFMGWLTSRDEITPEFSASRDASEVGQFCKENKLTDPRDGWETNLIHPLTNALTMGNVISLDKVITRPEAGELLDRLHDVIKEYDGDMGLAECLGVIELLKITMINTQFENLELD